MPQQGSRKRKAPAAAVEPDAKKERTEEEVVETKEGYKLNCKAVLFTWNVHGKPSANDALGALEQTPHWDNVMRYTICAEEASHWHIHAYLEFKKRVDHSADGWKLWNVAPDIRPNTVSGTGFATAVRRGSFYVANEYKHSFRSHVMNFYPAADYSVKTQWLIDQWSQGKIRDAVQCAGKYRCLTQPFKQLVTMSQGQQTSLDRQEFITERRARLFAQARPFKRYPEVDAFMEQFKKDKFRYSFLWLWGVSKLGKTELAKSLEPQLWHHRNSINWADYNSSEHNSIIFDDCPEIETYITNHKMLFQASEVTTVNTSRTNCYALEVDTIAKRITVCANHPPFTTWVLANAHVLNITEETWEGEGVC